jgi:hypothetical protein
VFYSFDTKTHLENTEVSKEFLLKIFEITIPTTLAPIEAAASCGGVRRRSYSGKREIATIKKD